jgi:hypothetical protein
VNVPPTKSGDNENPALTTPLSDTGRPEERDAELGRELADYGESQLAGIPKRSLCYHEP